MGRATRFDRGAAILVMVAGVGVPWPGGAAPKTVPDFILDPAPVAAPSLWQVAGRVIFRKGTPAAAVEVFLTSVNGAVVDRAQTDTQGHYRLSAPGPGRYEVRVDQSAATRRRGLLAAPFKQVITLE